jgi:hypothetical protein
MIRVCHILFPIRHNNQSGLTKGRICFRSSEAFDTACLNIPQPTWVTASNFLFGQVMRKLGGVGVGTMD